MDAAPTAPSADGVGAESPLISKASDYGAKPSSTEAATVAANGDRHSDGNGSERPESVSNLGAWFVIGLLNNLSYNVMLSAAERIIPHHAGLVLLADIGPTFLVKLTAGFWAHRLSYGARFWINTLAACLSFYMAAWFAPMGLKLLGIAFASFASGWGEVTGLSLTAFYSTRAIDMWSSGTGFSGIMGAGLVVGLIDSAGLSPQAMLTISGVMPLAYGATFQWWLGRSTYRPASAEARLLDGSPAPGEAEEERAAEAERQLAVEVAAAETDVVSAQESGVRRVLGSAAEARHHSREGVVLGGADGQLSNDITRSLTTQERLRIAWKLVPYMVPMAAVYFGEYMINTGVLTTLSFPAQGLTRAEFYERASLTYQLGVFLSRSSGLFFKIPLLWPMAALQTLNIGLALCQAFWNPVESSWLMLLFVFWVGLLGGALYVNAFRLVREDMPEELVEFSLSVASLADTVGILLASVAAQLTEPAIDSYRTAHGFDPDGSGAQRLLSTTLAAHVAIGLARGAVRRRLLRH